MKRDGAELFEQLFGDKSFKAPTPEPKLGPGDYCVKCKEVVEKIPVVIPQTMSGIEDSVRSLFYCNNHSCEHFGVLTLVIKRVK
jgi:hypothetical protein